MNCKPGDLAQIVRVGDPDHSFLLMSLVRCDRYLGPTRGCHLRGDAAFAPDTWECTPLSPTLAALVAKTRRNMLRISDAFLRPLPGDLTPETTDEEQPCTA